MLRNFRFIQTRLVITGNTVTALALWNAKHGNRASRILSYEEVDVSPHDSENIWRDAITCSREADINFSCIHVLC